MKKHLNFIIYNDKNVKITFRIYPKTTTIYGFHDEKPKNWDEVYKVYYSWAIIYQYTDNDGEVRDSRKLFEMHCDEASVLPIIPDIIKYVMTSKKASDIAAMGQPAAEWHIEYDVRNNPFTEKAEESCKFEVFDNWYHNGYRFYLSKERTDEFMKWLAESNDYLLKVSSVSF